MSGTFIYDSNRNSSSSSGVLDTDGGRIRLIGPDRKIADSAFVGQIRAGFEHDLGFQRQHRLTGSVRALHSEQVRLDRFTTSGLDGRLQLNLDFRPVVIEPWVSAGYIHLSHQQYHRSVGGGLRVRYAAARDLELSVLGSAVADNFDDLSEQPVEHLRSGAVYRVGFAARHALREDMRVRFSSEWLRKTAGAKFYRFWGTRQRVEHEWFLGKGAFLLSQLAWEYEFYDALDPNDAPMRQHRHRIVAGATLGVPLSAIVRDDTILSLNKRTILTVGIDFTRGLSNVTNYTYSNWRFMVGITISAVP